MSVSLLLRPPPRLAWARRVRIVFETLLYNKPSGFTVGPCCTKSPSFNLKPHCKKDLEKLTVTVVARAHEPKPIEKRKVPSGLRGSILRLFELLGLLRPSENFKSISMFYQSLAGRFETPLRRSRLSCQTPPIE